MDPGASDLQRAQDESQPRSDEVERRLERSFQAEDDRDRGIESEVDEQSEQSFPARRSAGRVIVR
jgi:hypothetical protein